MSKITDIAHRAASAYLYELRTNELRTKCITAGVLNFVSEVLIRHFAGAPPSKPLRKNASAWGRFLVWSKINGKAVKLALYGGLIAAPMSHFFVTTMHKAFAGRLRNGVQWHMIGTSMLFIAPIQIATYLTSLSYIENGPSKPAVKKTFKAAFVPAIIVTWLTAPPSLAYAQRNFPFEFEMPFFNIVQFFTGTLFGTITLKKKLREEAENDAKRR